MAFSLLIKKLGISKVFVSRTKRIVNHVRSFSSSERHKLFSFGDKINPIDELQNKGKAIVCREQWIDSYYSKLKVAQEYETPDQLRDLRYHLKSLVLLDKVFALSAINHLRRNGIMDVDMCKSGIICYSSLGESTFAFSMLGMAMKNGWRIDKYDFTAVLGGLIKEGKHHLVVELFHDMLTIHGIPPNRFIYNLMVDPLCYSGYYGQALDFLNKLGCENSMIKYLVLLQCLLNDDKIMANALFAVMIKKRITADFMTYHSVPAKESFRLLDDELQCMITFLISNDPMYQRLDLKLRSDRIGPPPPRVYKNSKPGMPAQGRRNYSSASGSLAARSELSGGLATDAPSFVLRNLFRATLKHDVYLMQIYSVMHWSSLLQRGKEIIGAAQPVVATQRSPRSLWPTLSRMHISRIFLKDNLLVADGFKGELLFKFLDHFGVAFCRKLAADEYSVTNDIAVYHNTDGSLRVLTANNDAQARVSDLVKFACVNSFPFHWSTNNASASDDGKLLSILGYSTHGLVVDARSGKIARCKVQGMLKRFQNAKRIAGEPNILYGKLYRRSKVDMLLDLDVRSPNITS